MWMHIDLKGISYEKHSTGCSCRFRRSFRLSVLVKSTKNRCKVQTAKISTECPLNFCQVVQQRCFDLESPSFVPVLPTTFSPLLTQLPLFLCLSHNYHSALSFFVSSALPPATHTLQTVKWDRNSHPSIKPLALWMRGEMKSQGNNN